MWLQLKWNQSLAQLILSASYKLGFNGKWLEHSQRVRRAGWSPAHSDLRGRCCIQAGEQGPGPEHDTARRPPLPTLWARSCGCTQVTATHALAAGTDGSGAFPGPEGGEGTRERWGEGGGEVGEVSLNRCMYTKPMKERFGLRNKYVPNPRNHAAE